MCERSWGTALKVGVGASAIGGALYGIGYATSCATVKVVALPFLAVGGAALSPFALAAAGLAIAIGLVVALLPVFMVLGIIQSFRAWRLLRRIDRLDRAGASDEEYDAAFRQVERLQPSQNAIGGRVRDENCPSRRRWLAFLRHRQTLEEVALRGSDPLAPAAWQRALKIGWGRECDLPDAQIVHLWARAITSEEPLALPVEMAATREYVDHEG